MNSPYKVIIFFATKSNGSMDFKIRLEQIKFIKVFATNDIDEVQQIIDMSEKAVILVDDEIAANKLFKATLNKTKSQFKKFYLNWYMNVTRDIKEKLLEYNYTAIDSEEMDLAIERVELYLFGRIAIFKKADYVPEVEVKKENQLTKGYFTHLERYDRSWKILISSHESDDEINEVLGVSWDVHRDKIVREAIHMAGPSEVRLESSPYHEVIFPHIENGKVSKLSIVHVNIDENYAESIMNTYKFLQALK
ncbi:MAG TPA: hypothetical protein VNJ08_10230 [Bacteriovoracaceae bacterium]|nr:hypothetical protein [Bacteriovoracaceae bacterium]